MPGSGQEHLLETDPRLPSGEWRGFFLYPGDTEQQHWMRLLLSFQTPDLLRGEGHDYVGAFTFEGQYNLSNGVCRWTKHYVGQHDVFYVGVASGSGIAGTWEIPLPPGMSFIGIGGTFSGQFHIWPDTLGLV